MGDQCGKPAVTEIVATPLAPQAQAEIVAAAPAPPPEIVASPLAPQAQTEIVAAAPAPPPEIVAAPLAPQAQTEIVAAAPAPPPAVPVPPPAPQAYALAAQALAAQALATQAQAFAVQAQVLAAQAPPPAAQVQVVAAQAQVVAAQAQVVAAQAQVVAAQAHALTAQAHALAAQAQVLAAQAHVAPNYDVDAAERRVHAYQEIAILQDINLRYPFHKLALEDWERREKYLSESISRREGQSNDLTNQIYTILGIFAVFQGVVLSAVMQMKQTAHPEYRAYGVVPVCGKIWSPIVLSLFATGATLVGIADKFINLKSMELRIHKETQAQNEVSNRALRLRSDGPQNFKFHLHADNSRPATEPKLVKKRALVYVFFLIFTGICNLSYFVILCDSLVIRKWDGGLHK